MIKLGLTKIYSEHIVKLEQIITVRQPMRKVFANSLNVSILFQHYLELFYFWLIFSDTNPQNIETRSH